MTQRVCPQTDQGLPRRRLRSQLCRPPLPPRALSRSGFHKPKQAACTGEEVCDKRASLSPSDQECCLLGHLEVQPHLFPVLSALGFGSSQLSG